MINPLKSVECMGFVNSYTREIKHEFWVKQCLIKRYFDSYSACKNKNPAHCSSLCKFGLHVTLLLTQSNLSGRCWNLVIMGRGRDVLCYQFSGTKKFIIKRNWVNPLFFMAVVSGRFRSSSTWGDSLFQTLR